MGWSSKAVLDKAATGAHARQAPVNEPSGASFVSGDWVEIDHCAHDHGGQFELGRELRVSRRRFSRLPQVKIEWALVWRALRPREEPESQCLEIVMQGSPQR